MAAAEKRRGYTNPLTLGDSNTQRRAFELSNNGMDYEGAVGIALEEQRQAALLTPGVRDDQYFLGELTRWSQNNIELGSSYHHVVKNAGVSVKENPFEVKADLSLQVIKGSEKKRSEYFSPLSGTMKQHLPDNTRGLQDVGWDTARTGKAQAGSFMQAIQVINSSSGGFVTGKVGQPTRTSIKSPTSSFGGRISPTLDESNAKRPFVSSSVSSPGNGKTGIDKLNSDVGGFLGLRATAYDQSPVSQPKDFIGTLREQVRSTPFLGLFYDIGSGIDKNTIQNMSDWVTSVPVLSNIAKGGEVFGLKKNVEFMQEKGSATEYNAAVDKYQKAAVALVGPGSNEEQSTSGIAAPFIEAGKTYNKVITEPFSKFVSPLGTNPVTNVIKDAATGFVSVPGSVPEMIGSAIVGGERLAKNVGNTPGLAAAGFAMQAEGFISNPVRSGAALLGTYALFSGSGAVINKGVGFVRTSGKSYIPIEQIGYDANAGFPLAPKGMTKTQLKSSFERSTFDPAPTKMSVEGKPVPHVPANTALPGEAAGKTYMWTAWERSPRMSSLSYFKELS
ncbi:MAG: hypothetical protein WCY09_10350, partial [Candidatus Omnitrophota bacterium]